MMYRIESINGSNTQSNTISVTIDNDVGTVFVKIFGSPSITVQAVDGRTAGVRPTSNKSTTEPKANGNKKQKEKRVMMPECKSAGLHSLCN